MFPQDCRIETNTRRRPCLRLERVQLKRTQYPTGPELGPGPAGRRTVGYSPELAREVCELLAEAVEIADDPAETVQRARLRADVRLKQAAAMTPKTRVSLAPPREAEPSYEDLLEAVMRRYPDPDE